jgi:putative SOS response-associated peptidase YedK
MCSRFSLTKSPQEIGKYFDIQVPQGLQRPPSGNIRRTENVLGLVRGGEGPQLRLLHWGMLIPVASQAKPKLVINAKAETAPERRSFRELIASAAHRVIVPAELWYERRYAFDVPGCEVIGLAGLAKEVTIDGETQAACVILTCDPAGNRVASEVHDRMPAVLADRGEQQEWMDPGVGAEHAASLCRVLPESRLRRKLAKPEPLGSGQEQLQLI